LAGNFAKRVYTTSDLYRMKLRGKPTCPYCGKVVSFIFDDVQTGHISQRCPNCNHRVLVDAKLMVAHKVVMSAEA